MVHNVWHIRMCVTCHTMRDTSECILVWHIRMCNVTQNKNAFLHSRMCVTHQNACHTFCVTFLRVTWLRMYEGVAYERVMWHVKMYERVVSHVRTTYTWAYGGVVGVTEDRPDMSYGMYVTWRHMTCQECEHVICLRHVISHTFLSTCHMSSCHIHSCTCAHVTYIWHVEDICLRHVICLTFLYMRLMSHTFLSTCHMASCHIHSCTCAQGAVRLPPLHLYMGLRWWCSWGIRRYKTCDL